MKLNKVAPKRYRDALKSPNAEAKPRNDRKPGAGSETNRSANGRTANGSGQKGNKAITGAASEAFARWLHH